MGVYLLAINVECRILYLYLVGLSILIIEVKDKYLTLFESDIDLVTVTHERNERICINVDISALGEACAVDISVIVYDYGLDGARSFHQSI